MKNYIGVKEIRAKEMTRGDFCKYTKRDLEPEEKGDAKGYLVEYINSPNSNHPDFDNYISWSPKDVFERAYRTTDGMTFGQAIEALKKGYKVTRKGWNGKGKFLFLVSGSTFKVNRPPLLGIYKKGTEIKYHARIDMKTTIGEIVPWMVSQTDILAEDWEMVK